MIALNSFFATLLITIFVASTAEAAPWPVHARHSTHRARSLGKRATKLDTYHPKSTFQTFKPDATLQGRAFTDLRTSCMEWVQNRLGLEADQLQWQSGVTNSVGQYGFVKQSLNGIAVSNAVANVAFKDGQAVTFGSSFVNATSVADAKPTISEAAAVAAAEESADGKANDQAVRIEYIITQGGAAELAYAVQVQNAKTGAFQEIFVNAHNGQILSMNDFVADATYKVLPIEKVTLDQGFETLTDPEDIAASPLGWHDDGTTQSTTTTGNNVVAFLASNQQAVTSASAGNNANNLVFDFDHNPAADPNVGQNADLAVTNAFYLMNTIHDITYRYGFTEAAFNFQSNNFNKGGRAGDPVLMDVQDASGVNNAAFATPPDGQSGQCQMFIWTLTQPNRDGSLENDIPIHEMMHGVTNRMTGGGTGRCLQTLEAGGMGEGWSDAMADWMQQSSATVTDFSLGTFVTNNPAGIRSAPYSTSAATNTLTYGSLRTRNQVHEIGEVWANMLHNVYAALVAAKGFSQDAKTNPDATGGNAVFLRLLMDALLLQPCNPTFVQARDAFVSADIARFNGENTCTVLTAFASRGLGANAGPDFVDDNTVGNGCA